jgi:5-formyltetrahydrofolate cyclo-ligase
MGSNPAIAAEKERLRRHMRAVRAAIPPEERGAAAAAVEAALLELPVVADATTMLAFASFGSEIPTAGILAGLRAAGKRMLLPFLVDGEMEAALVEPDEAMAPSSYGALEPAVRRAVDPSVVDAVVAPGLAFDRAGRRLGYGGGYFDRYLRRIPEAAARIGIGFAVQLVDEVPVAVGDELLDLVVTEAGVVECSPGRRSG